MIRKVENWSNKTPQTTDEIVQCARWLLYLFFILLIYSFSGRYFQLIDSLKGPNGNIVKHSHFYLGCAYLVYYLYYYIYFLYKGC